MTATKKIVLIGPERGGKTSIVNSMIDNPIRDNYSPTIGCIFQSKTMRNSLGEETTLLLWDTAGGHRYIGFANLYCHNANKIILVVPSNQPLATNELLDRMRRVRDNPVDIEVVLNQFEGEEPPLVTMEDLAGFIEEAKFESLKLSDTIHIVNAKANEGIEDLLEHLASTPEQAPEAVLVQRQAVFPKSYSSLWATPHPLRGATTVDHMKQVLLDYTKDNHGWKRFATLHWNRHHCKEVAQVISSIEADTTPKDILDALKGIENVKSNGSFGRRIQFMEQQVQADSPALNNF